MEWSSRVERKKEYRRLTNRDPNLDREGKPVQLHQSDNPWRPPSKENGDEKEKNRVLLRAIRCLLNGATPSRKEALIAVFLEYKVHESNVLNEVISIIFDAAVETPAYCDLYAAMCAAQVGSELLKKQDKDSSRFKSEILKKVKDTFNTKTISGQVGESLRKERMGHINFIGYLYLDRIVPFKFMHFRVLDLLKSINEKQVDEELIECAIRLIEIIGKKMEEEEEFRTDECRIQTIFDLLEMAKDRVSNRVRLLMANLTEYRNDNWRGRKEVNTCPRLENYEGYLYQRALRENEGRKKEEKENIQIEIESTTIETEDQLAEEEMNVMRSEWKKRRN